MIFVSQSAIGVRKLNLRSGIVARSPLAIYYVPVVLYSDGVLIVFCGSMGLVIILNQING